jgi:integrase
MPSKEIQWPKLRPFKTCRGKRTWIVDATLDGKRERKYFTVKKDAEVWQAQKASERENLGRAAFAMPDAVRIEAAELHRKLSVIGVTLTDAVEFFLKHARSAAEQRTVQQVIDEMLQKRRENGRSEEYLRVQKITLSVFAKAFGDRPIHTVMSRDVEDWLSSNPHWKPRTRLNYQRDLRGLWSYALKRKYASLNPLERLEAPIIASEPPGILTPKQAEDLLKKAADPAGDKAMLAYVAIGLFAGLRSAEIERLDWSEVDLEAKLIEVTAKKAKTRQRRHVGISDNLRAWLDLCPKKRGGVAPAMSRLDLQLVRLAEKAGIKPWPKNALRHSFASYNLAKHKDAAKTALELGHYNQDMLFRNYRELVRPAEAEEYWKILPP